MHIYLINLFIYLFNYLIIYLFIYLFLLIPFKIMAMDGVTFDLKTFVLTTFVLKTINCSDLFQSLMRLCQPPDGSTSPKYKLLQFNNNYFFTKSRMS
jgi:hypothetical protein